MASKFRLLLAELGMTSLVWLACTIALALASLMLAWKLIFGADYREQALKDVQRLEFEVVYEDGNALPQNLTGEALSLETALAMSAAAGAAPRPAPDTEAKDSPTEEPISPAEESAEETPLPHPLPAVESDTPPQPDTSEPQAVPQADATTDEEDAAPLPTPIMVESSVPLTPVEKMTEKGILPVIAEDGTMPWQYFAKKDYARNTEYPRIAVIVQGLGLSKERTEAAMTLPREVTLSFSPYGRSAAQDMAEAARERGHEILLDLPMQTERYPSVDPGPYGLRTTATAEENHANLLTVLTKLRGYVGLLAPARDSLSLSRELTAPLVDRLSAQGLLFVSGYSQRPEGMFRLTRQATIPILFTHVELDGRVDETYIRNQLARAEDIARTQGHAVVVGKSYPITLELLDAWTQQLPQKRFTLVPVTALANTGQ